jgi:hypothetical protein
MGTDWILRLTDFIDPEYLESIFHNENEVFSRYV